MKKLWRCILTASIFLSCSSVGNEEVLPVTIQVDPGKLSGLYRSDLMNLTNVIQLEYPGGYSLGSVSRFRIMGDYFLVAGEQLALFELNGRFSNFIGHKGRGPGEYLSISGLAYGGKQIKVLDRTQQKVLVYSPEGGFVGEYSLGFFGQACHEMGEGMVIYTGNEANEDEMRLFLFDPEFNQKGTALERNPERSYLNVFDKSNFFQFNEQLRFLLAYDDRVYNLRPGKSNLEMDAAYVVDFGQHQIPEAFFDQSFSNIMEFEMALNQTDYAGRITGFYENENLVWFAFRYRGDFLWAIFSKQDGLVQVVDKLKDDVAFPNGEVSVLDEWFSMFFNGNQGYLVLEAAEFVDRVNKMQERMSLTEWTVFLDSGHIIIPWIHKVQENDPPLVFVFEMKR